MIQLLSVWKWISSHLKTVMLIVIVVLILLFLWNRREISALKTDKDRISENFEQKDEKISQLTLKVGEYEKLKTKHKKVIDSLLVVIDKKAKDLEEATVISESYIDTNSIEPDYSEPTVDRPAPANNLLAAKPIYSIPVSTPKDLNCWGMKGVIKSTDPKARLIITERIFNNSIQLLDIKRKKFLWWTIRKEQLRAFTDCGKELKVTRIKFVKK